MKRSELPAEYRFRAPEVVVSGQVGLVDDALAYLGLSELREDDASFKEPAVGNGRAGSPETVAETSEELAPETEGAEDESEDESDLSVPSKAAIATSPVKVPAVEKTLASGVVKPTAVLMIVCAFAWKHPRTSTRDTHRLRGHQKPKGSRSFQLPEPVGATGFEPATP